MASRYYDEKNEDIQPGKISAELRAALNLAENDVPIWIYRMRALGYPPGWLSKAIVDTSDIFDTDSEPNESGSSKRKGAPDESVQYDHSKLIEYPGFNTPLPPNTQDYHYYYNMPPMLPHQQLDYAKKTMSSFKPAQMPPTKRNRTSTSSGQAKDTDNNRSTNNESSSGSSGDEEEDNEDEEDDDGDDDDESPESPDAEGTTNGKDKLNASKSSDKNNRSIGINQSSTSLNSTLNEGIKLVSKGSPMPKPVERMPLERFSEGVVGELLYFENIPNSTGKFDSLRGLLNTMRRSKGECDNDDNDADQSKGQAASSTSNNSNIKKEN